MLLPHGRGVLLGMFAASAFAVVAACAESEEPSRPIAEDGGTPEASTPPDAGDDPPADAGARTCSDQNFCHVDVPPKETLRAVWGAGTTVWAVSEEGDVLRWDGQKWNVHSQKLGALYAIWGSGPTDIWVGGERGLHHGTGPSAESLVFEPVDAPGDPTIPITSIWGAGADDVVAVGGHMSDVDFMPHSRVLTLRGGAGATWQLDPVSDEPFACKRVWGSAAVGTWIAGDEGYEVSQIASVFVRAPGSDDFAPVTIDASPPNGMDPGVPSFVYAGGVMADGRVLVIGKTSGSTGTYWYASVGAGGALTWSFDVRADTDDQPLHQVWSLPGKDTWIAGDYGRLRGRGAGGGPWTPAALMVSDLPVIEPLYGIWGTAADDFWVVGRDTAIHRMPKKEP